jgi:glycosyltransferase involved in cell wall biosynthesis
MRAVIDAIPVRYGGFAVALEALLSGWDGLGLDDELHLVKSAGVELEIPAAVTVHEVRIRRPAALTQASTQSIELRRICREVDADVLLAILPTTSVTPVGCPKVITVYDLRHELLPDQFSRARRLMRKVSYGIGYRQADAIICISQRTRDDLLRLHPRLNDKPVRVVLWGAEHVDSWPRRDPPPGGEPYALAFGHFVNKGVERVLEAWQILARRGEARPLVFVGLPSGSRPGVEARIEASGLSDVVTPLPWLDADQFHERFASAGLIVFPSDFEGFGLPAVEAMRLGIPLVISPDPALLEVTGGNAETMDGWDAAALAEAVSRAWSRSAADLARAQTHVASFTWSKMATETRAVLADVIAAST